MLELDDGMYQRLTDAAAKSGVSPADEVKNILHKTLLEQNAAAKVELLAEMDRFKQSSQKASHEDSTQLIRENRDWLNRRDRKRADG
ncbi:MAG: hypothetical protein GC154_07460 [bacterium]|nr:hypothetical protein [bacterium]